MSQHEQGIGEETAAWTSDLAVEPVRDLTGATLGDFQIRRLLGRGGMGQVYLATQISLNRPVALKVLHPGLLSKSTYLSRFEAEATAVAKLNHPNIVHVYTLGCIEEVRFIAMEYVEGTNLREYISRKGTIDLSLALSIMRQAGQAIGAAGEVGLVHRDIKPENLLLTRKGRVKVADFGLCRDLGARRLHVTQPGITMGTPLYMSPEQAQSRPLDHRSDLYSLGVTFYHMLTGEPPFRAESAVALALKHVSETPVGLRVLRPEIPVELDRLVMKLMAKNPVDRYQSAAEMLADLTRVRSALGTSMGPPGDENNLSMLRSEETDAPSAPSVKSLMVIDSGIGQGPAGPTLFRPRNVLAAAALFFLAGVAAGWAARPPGLPGSDAVARKPPGLWLEPRWSQIPRQNSAEEQYRYAQFQASIDNLTAAWLAVPGYFERSAEWVSPAYLQFARRLYRQRDIDRLTVFRTEILAWRAAKTPELELARIIDPALKLLARDLDGVIDAMSRIASPDERARSPARDEPNIYDPGLIEFSVEIVADALSLASQPGPQAGAIKTDRLAAIQDRLITYLRKVRMSDWASR
jgi:serine/threonine-protein kinase